MPFIEEKDLFTLHKDLEKSQNTNIGLLDQIRNKNKEIKRLNVQRYTLISVLSVLVVCVMGVFAYVSGVNQTQQLLLNNASRYAISTDSLDATRKQIEALRRENQELSMVQDYYLSNRLIKQQVVYSVQVKSLRDSNLDLTHNGLTNNFVVKSNPFLRYSIGVFETIDEARVFRNHLVKLGFDYAFVASYQNGKRIKIESPY